MLLFFYPNIFTFYIETIGEKNPDFPMAQCLGRSCEAWPEARRRCLRVGHSRRVSSHVAPAPRQGRQESFMVSWIKWGETMNMGLNWNEYDMIVRIWIWMTKQISYEYDSSKMMKLIWDYQIVQNIAIRVEKSHHLLSEFGFPLWLQTTCGTYVLVLHDDYISLL